jgi:hypothetical protein
MAAVILLAILAAVLFGVGFAVHLLWWIAIAAVVIMLVSLLLHSGSNRHRLL